MTKKNKILLVHNMTKINKILFYEKLIHNRSDKRHQVIPMLIL